MIDETNTIYLIIITIQLIECTKENQSLCETETVIRCMLTQHVAAFSKKHSRINIILVRPVLIRAMILTLWNCCIMNRNPSKKIGWSDGAMGKGTEKRGEEIGSRKRESREGGRRERERERETPHPFCSCDTVFMVATPYSPPV